MKQGQHPSGRAQVLEDQDGRYYWRLQAASDRIIAWSGQAYDSEYWCVQDMNWLRATAHLIMVNDYTAEPPQDRHTPAGTPTQTSVSKRVRGSTQRSATEPAAGALAARRRVRGRLCSRGIATGLSVKPQAGPSAICRWLGRT